jgi:hypothetical protein
VCCFAVLSLSYSELSLGDQSTFDFFRQETSHADTVIRNEAMANLALVCSVSTPEKVRGDIIPYLQSNILFLLCGKTYSNIHS